MVVRRIVALVVALVVAVLGAGIFGEYEFSGIAVPVGAGVSLGYAVAAMLGSIGRWRGRVPAAVAAVLVGSSLLAAGWIDSDEGVERYPSLAIAAALIGVVTAMAVVGRRRLPARTARVSRRAVESST